MVKSIPAIFGRQLIFDSPETPSTCYRRLDLLFDRRMRFLHKVWWTPFRIQRDMGLQGIKGPSYKFLYGTTTEMITMIKESTAKPMDLSHAILPRMQPHIYTWVKLYGNNFLNWYGPKPQLVVTDLELVKEILTKDGAYPRGEIPIFVKKLIGDGILSSKGEKWIKLRKIANHAFYTESLKQIIPAITASVETMLEERWRQHEGKEIDMSEEFRLLTSEVISRTAFGSSFKEGENIFDMLKKLAEIISRKQLQNRFPLVGKIVKSEDELEENRLDKSIQESVLNIVRKREKQMKAGEENNTVTDFLGLLITASHDPDEKKRVSQQEIIDECKTFYNSGQDTTTSLLSWVALLLAIHTDWQEKARIEVLELFGREIPNPESLSKLKTMSMIINETLRLYTPVVNIVRSVQSEVRLGNVILPPNMELLIPPLALHHDPKIWGEDVHLFKPERFAEGVAKATNGNAMAFLPFGYGPRFCVGMNFATMEVKVALSMILQRYKFTLLPSYVHAPIKVLTIRPQHGVPVLLQTL